MFRFTFSKTAIALCFIALPVLGACSGGANGTEEATVESGSVTLPLVTVTDGHIYRLRGAYVYISGPSYSTFLNTTDDPAETTLSATVPTGNYYAYLSSWSLERDDGAGQFFPVQATLVSDQSLTFRVFHGATSTLSFVFQTDGVSVTVGAGDVRVKISVNETPAACTPFGSDCTAGSWCPPTGLTGAPRACIAAGQTAVGEPCARADECTANAACIDLGAGAVCAALCSSADFDAPCASGGVCRRAGSEYGICKP